MLADRKRPEQRAFSTFPLFRSMSVLLKLFGARNRTSFCKIGYPQIAPKSDRNQADFVTRRRAEFRRKIATTFRASARLRPTLLRARFRSSACDSEYCRRRRCDRDRQFHVRRKTRPAPAK